MSRSLAFPARSIALRSVFDAGCFGLCVASIALLTPVQAAPAPPEPMHIAAPDLGEVDVVGELDGDGRPQKTMQDTVWIADWSFDSASGCTSTGWVAWDNRILNVNNDAEFWHIDNRFAGVGPIVGRAAILSKHDLCWVSDGYGNDNDFSIILKYSGSSATLSFVKMSDGVTSFDLVNVECDSLGLSEVLANPSINPRATSPAVYRDEILSTSGLDNGSFIGPMPLTNFGPGTHEVYIRFISDGIYSDEDFEFLGLGAGLVVDNILVTGDIAYSEDFEGALGPNVTLLETANALHEVNFLPTIEWDPGYLAAIAGDPEGDVAPTPSQIAGSTQKNCVLYYQKLNSRRRSGDLNRTSFMYTLDDLGYKGEYDVFDVQGYGNTANQLSSRANVGQASGYSLIIQDDGRSNLVPNIPAGQDRDGSKQDQAGWYRSYLAQGSIGFAGSATLWVIGENTAFLHREYPLFTTDFGVSLGATDTDQGLSVNPMVRGHASNTFANGGVVNFAGDDFALQGGCPAVRAYDTADPTAGATQTHRYAVGATNGRGAIIMNRNAALKWNTVWMGFGWFDIRFSGTPANPTPQSRLATQILSGTIAAACNHPGGTTDTGDGEVIDAPPTVTALHQNVPNPFNPTTKITYDLARNGHVKLQVFNVAGHLVKTLIDGARQAGRDQEAVWNGLDQAGNRAPSGVYFYQLVTDELTHTRKMALLK